MSNNTLSNQLADELSKFDLQVKDSVTFERLKASISAQLNQYITSDFSRLISLLYRLDISEKKLKDSLQQAGNTKAADIIAEMIIQRQLQKIEARKSFKTNSDIPDEERW